MNKWLQKILDKVSRRYWLAERLKKSLKRDDGFPVKHLLRKGSNLMMSLLLSRHYLKKCDQVGKYPRTEKKPYIVNNGKIRIGDFVNLTSRSVRCELVTYPTGEIEIGNNVFVNFGTTIVAKRKVRIEDNVKIGPYSMIHDTDFHIPGEDFKHSEGKPITIEKNAWLNSRVLVMKGSVIGEGAVIAAGSIVSGIIPPYVIAGGVPAKIIRHLKKPGENNSPSRKIKEKEEIPAAILKQVSSILANIVNVPVLKIKPTTAPYTLPKWTSSVHTQFMDQLEMAFDVDIDPDTRIRMHTIERICRMLQKETIKTPSNS